MAARAAGLCGAAVLAGCASDVKEPDEVTAVDRMAAADAAALVDELLAAGENERANAVADRILELDPYAPVANLAVARARAAWAVEKEQPRLYQDAVRRATFACEAAPGDAEAFFTRGKLQYDRRWYSHALADFRRAVELDATRADARRYVAWCHRSLREPKNERRAWEEFLAARPDDPAGHYHLGMLLLGSADEADQARGRELLERAVAIEPGHDLALHALADLAADADDLPRAEELLRRAAAATEANARGPGREADVLYNLARVVERQGRLEEARGLYQRSVDLAPDDPRSVTNLGLVLIELGQIEDGMVKLRDALPLVDDRAVREQIQARLEELEDVESPRERRKAQAAGGAG